MKFIIKYIFQHEYSKVHQKGRSFVSDGTFLKTLPPQKKPLLSTILLKISLNEMTQKILPGKKHPGKMFHGQLPFIKNLTLYPKTLIGFVLKAPRIKHTLS